MAKCYRPVDRDQPFLFPPDMREWLPPGHPVWLVISVVADHLDTSAFHAGRKTGGAGAAGYDPDMLVTVLVWAYAHQVTSSRRIERLCQTDVAFRVICGGNLPDHVTFARFRAGFAGAVGEFFSEVLVLCARLGMGRLGVVALDGMKITASASKAANRGEQALRTLAAGTVARHGQTDQAGDELFGPGVRGDEPPGGGDGEGGWSPRRRGERIAAALAGLQAERAAAREQEAAKAERFRARRAAGARPGPAPASSAVELAEEKVARVRAAQQARIKEWNQRNAVSLATVGRPLRGSPPVPAQRYCRVKQAEARLDAARAAAAARQAAQQGRAAKNPGPVRNITDPDSRLMPTRNGFIQGYNTQNVDTEDGLIIATELTADTTDMAWFEPMLARAQAAATLITAHQPATAGQQPGAIALMLADAGYCSEANLTCAGPDRLIATGKNRDLAKAARSPDSSPAGPGGPATQAMRERLKTGDGMTAYRQRGHIAETPHGNIKHNMGFRQLSMRGKPKAAAEWQFTTTVHNLFKAITTGHLTRAALDTLNAT
jgi:transposase